MSDRVYILPLWIRLWHWSNALLMLVLMATGVSLHFADPAATWLVPFEVAARVHILAGLGVAVLYGGFVIGNAATGNWWQYVPKPQGWRERVARQMRFYFWGIFRGEPHPYPPTPQANFNALQQLIYWVVMYLCMPLLVLTGLIFTWPDLAPREVFGRDGLIAVAVVHYLAGLIIALFMLAHIYLATTGERLGSLIRMMITGWHEHHETDHARARIKTGADGGAAQRAPPAPAQLFTHPPTKRP